MATMTVLVVKDGDKEKDVWTKSIKDCVSQLSLCTSWAYGMMGKCGGCNPWRRTIKYKLVRHFNPRR